MQTRRQKNISGDRLKITRRSTRSKTSEDGRENSSLPIPIDVIVEIFSRLPLKSIAICRCVSKLWASILLRPDFTELFLTKSSARPQILFAGLKYGELFFFSSPQPQVPVLNSSPVDVNPLTRFTFASYFEIRGLVNGLVCVEHLRILKGRREMVVVICNPSTGQSLTLPKLKTSRIGMRILFGYDLIDKQYKVLSTTRHEKHVECEEHHVLTLGGTGKLSWRMIECRINGVMENDGRNYSYSDKEICINGVLYYPSVDRSTETYLIVCFDIRSEKFSFIKVEEPLKHAVFYGTMIDYNGKLGTSFLLWVLENPEKQEWSEHIYVLPALWKNIVGEAKLRFAGVTRSNEIVLSSNYQPNPFYLIYFSLERNTLS